MTSQHPANHIGHSRATSYSEMTLRLFSAGVLVGITLIGVYLGSWIFSFLIIAVALLMIWEWCWLVADDKSLFLCFFQGFGIIAALILASNQLFLFSLLILFFGTCFIFALGWFNYFTQKVSHWIAVGYLYIGLPSVAMIWFRQDDEFGFLGVLYIFILVWVTDSMAFFGGRFIGGMKLWPQISPNKTWSGFIGGILGSLFVGLIFAFWLVKPNVFILCLFSLILGTSAQIGDLVESAMKRRFGTKDTGSLIPGHGGILDRVDSMVFTAGVAAILALLIDSENPAQSLLFG